MEPGSVLNKHNMMSVCGGGLCVCARVSDSGSHHITGFFSATLEQPR